MKRKRLAVSVIIPNWNGKQYLQECLESLRRQSFLDFEVIVVDNGSKDGSVAFIKQEYPEIKVLELKKNEGFCSAVNKGILVSRTPYVILLNNDTRVEKDFVKEMLSGIQKRQDCFSCQAKMMQMNDPGRMDDGGNFYSALGWAFAEGKGKSEKEYEKEKEIFSSCAGAAIYRKAVFQKIGLFDEAHFAYLEDLDMGYRAKICGYHNWFLPKAKVYHVGSGSTGSQYNGFKVKYSARNNLYLIYKNMPWWQIIGNLPFLLAGLMIKAIFFQKKGFGFDYRQGIKEGIQLCRQQKKVKYQSSNLKNYLNIQVELWRNIKKSVFR